MSNTKELFDILDGLRGKTTEEKRFELYLKIIEVDALRQMVLALVSLELTLKEKSKNFG